MTARDVIAERLAMLEGSERPWHWHTQKAEAILEALVVAPDSVRQELAALLNPWRPKWRHKKRGSEYVVVGEAELQCGQDVIEGRELVIYRAKDGKLWARPPEEFYDGHFESLPAPPSEDK